MEAFFTFIFFTIITIYLVGMIGRWLLRRWIAKKQREFAEQFGQGAAGHTFRRYSWGSGGNGRRESGHMPEGEVRVQKPVRDEKRVSGNVGEYVDYEEIKE